MIDRRCNRPSRRASAHGLSLLEVMLSLAILGVSMATIGELIRTGARSAERARDLTVAQTLAESLLSQMQARIIPAQAVADTPVEDVDFGMEWNYSVYVQPLDQTGLISVSLTVSKNQVDTQRPSTVTLVRWMVDPLTQAASDATTTDPAAATTAF